MRGCLIQILAGVFRSCLEVLGGILENPRGSELAVYGLERGWELVYAVVLILSLGLLVGVIRAAEIESLVLRELAEPAYLHFSGVFIEDAEVLVLGVDL